MSLAIKLGMFTVDLESKVGIGQATFVLHVIIILALYLPKLISLKS